jgi:hypothetical protein
MSRLGVMIALVFVASCHRGGNGTGSELDDEDRVACDPAAAKQCIGSDIVACEPDGKTGRRIRTCKEGCRDNACVLSCDDSGTELIYVVDTAEELMSFDPRLLPDDPFHLVGHLSCVASGSPFSMAVDRHGLAWILYQGGGMATASILDAKCRPTAYHPGRERFGMGFASDRAGSDGESLYIAGNNSHELSTLDGMLQTHPIGPLIAAIDSSPELTGTSGGRLFGFYPRIDALSFVQEIDKQTGNPIGPQWPIDKEPMRIGAWAFAQWGGVFYVFVSTDDDSLVYAVDPRTGSSRVVRRDLPYRITGAGVSTCAPERDGTGTP